MTEKIVLAKYVNQIAELPYFPPIYLEDDSQKTLFLVKGSFWISIHFWLRNKVLSEAVPLEALQAPAMHFQPYADYYKALLDLANEVHGRSDNPIMQSFSSPAELWFKCLESAAQEDLQDSLLRRRTLTRKKEIYSSAMKNCRCLETLSFVSKSNPETYLETILALEAQDIAKRKGEHYFKNHHFKRFLKTVRQTAKLAYLSPHLQSGYLGRDGQMHIAGKKCEFTAEIGNSPVDLG